jgi:hypothetical protein
VWKVRSSSQTRCHFSSICCGSYLDVMRNPGYKKASHSRGRGKLSAATPRGLPALVKELLPVHSVWDFSNSLTSKP